MADPLEGCRTKLERAEEHLDALDAEVRRFRKSEPYRVRSKLDRRLAQTLYRVQESKSPPLHWPAMLGDCIHNFRSTLDYLAWEIVTKHGTPKDSTQFPICTARKRFRAGWGSKIGKVRRQGLQTAFDRLQPYKGRPHLYPLWILHRLDIIDKHRQLLTPTMPRAPMIRPTGAVGAPIEILWGPFDGSADVLRVAIPFGPNGPVKVKIETPFEVEIADVELTPGTPVSLPLTGTLHDIRDCVRLSMQRLGGFCD